MINIRGVTKRFGERLALDNVSVGLADGIVAVVGDSGAGKSTLLHVVAGLKRPDAGEVSVGGVDVTGLNDEGRRRFLVERVAAVVASVGDGSGGALPDGCCLVVADDPTAWLGEAEVAATAALLASLRAPGRVVLVASHEPVLWEVADQVVELADGRLLAVAGQVTG